MILVFVYLLATVLFLALLLSLGVQPKLITRLTGVILFVTGVLGTALYGYAYSVLFPSVPQAVIRTLFSVFCMFLSTPPPAPWPPPLGPGLFGGCTCFWPAGASSG